MGKRILITGAGSGIGRESAFALAERGHEVIASDRNEEIGAKLRESIKDDGVRMRVEKLNILDGADRERARDWEVDVLIDNAGIGQSGPLAEIPMERLRAVFETNVFATIALTQIIAQDMVSRGGGRIVIIGSLAGRVYVPYLGPYCMTKFALEPAANALRFELKPHNVHVSLIEPGPYGTNFNDRMTGKKYEWYDEKSFFAGDWERIEKLDEAFLSDQYRTASIVRKIVRAVESPRPRFRYVAPLKYAILARLAVLLGIKGG